MPRRGRTSRRSPFLAVIRRVRGLREDWVYLPAIFAAMYTQSSGRRGVLAVIRSRTGSRLPGGGIPGRPPSRPHPAAHLPRTANPHKTHQGLAWLTRQLFASAWQRGLRPPARLGAAWSSGLTRTGAARADDHADREITISADAITTVRMAKPGNNRFRGCDHHQREWLRAKLARLIITNDRFVMVFAYDLTLTIGRSPGPSRRRRCRCSRCRGWRGPTSSPVALGGAGPGRAGRGCVWLTGSPGAEAA